MKIDDDIVYLDCDKFQSFVQQIRLNKSSFLTTAFVHNRYFYASNFLASCVHYFFLKNMGIRLGPHHIKQNLFRFKLKDIKVMYKLISDKKEHLRPGRVSINFCGWTSDKWDTINYIFTKRNTGLGDEIVLSYFIPESLGLRNMVYREMVVVHYSFGGQRLLNSPLLSSYSLLSKIALKKEGIQPLVI